MTFENILEILKVVGFVVLGGFALYFKSKSALAEKVTSLIAQAENKYKEATKAGGQKFEWVIDHLYVYVPVWLRPLITREVISQIVQYIFDGVQAYAKLQLDKLVGEVGGNK